MLSNSEAANAEKIRRRFIFKEIGDSISTRIVDALQLAHSNKFRLIYTDMAFINAIKYIAVKNTYPDEEIMVENHWQQQDCILPRYIKIAEEHELLIFPDTESLLYYDYNKLPEIQRIPFKIYIAQQEIQIPPNHCFWYSDYETWWNTYVNIKFPISLSYK